MTGTLIQSVVVENRSGAGGTRGVDSARGRLNIVIDTLYDGLVRALKMPGVRESFGKEGSDVVVDASPAAFGRFVDREIAT
jgi:hypothetical protein